MSSLTNRGKVFVVLAFFASAALFGGAAVALLKASDHKRTAVQLPTGAPTVIYATQTPTPTASASATPTAKPTASASPRPVASATATASPAVHPTAHATQTAAVIPSGLQADATMNPASGPIGSNGFPTTLLSHASDTVGTIQPFAVTWGDGTSSNKAGTVCAHAAAGDCRNVTIKHTYTHAGRFNVYIRVTNGGQTTILHIVVNISPGATPSPA